MGKRKGQPEADGIKGDDGDVVLHIEIEYKPRTGWSRFRITPAELAGRRDLLRAALTGLDEHMGYKATTELAAARMMEDQAKAEVEAMRRKLEGK